MSKDDFKEAIEFITLIGYKHRTGTYYVIREKDGYINISHDKGFSEDCPINFYKNFTYPHQSLDKKYTIDKNFYTLEDFYTFISNYHNKLFLKLKLDKIMDGMV